MAPSLARGLYPFYLDQMVMVLLLTLDEGAKLFQSKCTKVCCANVFEADILQAYRFQACIFEADILQFEKFQAKIF